MQTRPDGRKPGRGCDVGAFGRILILQLVGELLPLDVFANCHESLINDDIVSRLHAIRFRRSASWGEATRQTSRRGLSPADYGGLFLPATTSGARFPYEPLISGDARLDLTVGVNAKLNRGHLAHGCEALVLPVISRSEVIRTSKGGQAVSIDVSAAKATASKGVLEPASPDCSREVEIVCRMAMTAPPDCWLLS